MVLPLYDEATILRNSLSDGSLHGTFDLGDGLKATFDLRCMAQERLKKFEMEKRQEFCQLPDGRIMMPNLGII